MSSFPIEQRPDGVAVTLTLKEGEVAWAMVGLDEDPAEWNSDRAARVFEETNYYWREWAGRLKSFPERNAELQRSAMTVHLLGHAPNNSLVAAATTSPSERLGGDRNYDYRYTWVRDASLALAFLTQMGNNTDVSRYLDWLCQLDSSVDSPLQVCYRTNGSTKLPPRPQTNIEGYRKSRPVFFGNRAYRQRQLGPLGFLAQCSLVYFEHGGRWKSEYWDLIHRAATYICSSWQEPDNGIWELPEEAHYVSSKVMAWVALDRTVKLAERTGEKHPADWTKTVQKFMIRCCVRVGAIKCALSVSAMAPKLSMPPPFLIPLTGFLPLMDSRVLSTIERIEERLVADGLVYRFDFGETLECEDFALGKFEGAFLPATFWLANVYAKMGRPRDCRAVLDRCEKIAGPLGIFAPGGS